MSAVSDASMRCRDAIPSARNTSSRDLGWRSLLIDVHDGVAWNHDYAAATTLDPRIGLSLSGHYRTHYYSRGTWRQDAFGPGSTTLLRIEDDRRFRFTPLKGQACRFALIYLPLADLEQAVDQLRRPGQHRAVPSYNQLLINDTALTHVALALVHAMEQSADELYAQTASTWLAVHLLVRADVISPTNVAMGGEILSDIRLRRVIDYIAVHCGDPVTLDQLAAEAGVSKFHFTRLFRDKTGLPPLRYLTKVRLSLARRMLEQSDLRVGEIALTCGYASASSFAAAFLACYGMAPSACRARTSPVSH